MRFHLATTFLSLDQTIRLVPACDEMGYSGIYFSDHLFNPRELQSKYTYSKAPDGSPFWEKDTEWPDPMCLISGLATITRNMLFTTGIYIAPVRDLITVAKSVGTAAVISDNRVRLGVGVGWCEEEYIQTGQNFRNRGKRLDEMIPALRALWQGGWVEYHGTYYDVPACQMNPSPSQPVPIIGGGNSEPAIRRAATLCDGWVNTGAAEPDDAFLEAARIRDAVKQEGRENDPFSVYLAIRAFPDLDLYRRLEEAGVTDLLCAPWMSISPDDGKSEEELYQARRDVCEQFAEGIIAKMG
jgi:probable F420-dependent oxidoreductase